MRIRSIVGVDSGKHFTGSWTDVTEEEYTVVKESSEKIFSEDWEHGSLTFDLPGNEVAVLNINKVEYLKFEVEQSA